LIASVNHFGPGRLKFGATATYVSQSGVFWPYAIDPAVAVGEYGEDAFWLVDLSLGYRLPNRRGLVALRLDNAFDEDFFYQDLDPENQSLMPERVLSLRFTLAY
jgi:outer membrane receptor protein involved in Fe transport